MTQPHPIRYADTLADCTDGGTRVQKVVSPLHRMRQLRVCTQSPHPHVITGRESAYMNALRPESIDCLYNVQ